VVPTQPSVHLLPRNRPTSPVGKET
jgi:hypothetical protein